MTLTTKIYCSRQYITKVDIRGDQEGLFKLVTLDRILNRITGVTSGCWWLVVVNARYTYIRYLSNKPTKHIQ
jgi:hypothetical protein